MNITERFLKYVSFHTTSDENTKMTPSTPGQMVFAKYLAEELKSIGMKEVTLDENGYVMATLPANTDKEDVPTIGFIAHMDTSPDASGKNIKPRIIENYDGGDILLNDEKAIVLETELYPEILQYKGNDIIVTDGTTLLGADDKAGIAEIVTAMEYLIAHPEIKHGKIRVGFTPDEEIGQGADHFDVEAFGAEWAYTMDGSTLGELEYENFNAAVAIVTINGLNVHPGYAKHKMKNSMRIATQFVSMLPRHETPEHTEGYEGFYHLVGMEGTVEKTTLTYIIRDHDRDKFENRKKEIKHLGNKINAEFGENTAVVEMRDQYYNMREKVEPVMHIVDLAFEAMKENDIEPIVKPIRGGTDGSRLSYEGLPCPNIFAGGHNFHGRFEYLPIQNMEKAMMVIVKIAELLEKKS
ncbi:MAG TPA: peptidase T [Bacteroidales bacterium]|nr:peptidase T [Bacteroidales bacterium]